MVFEIVNLLYLLALGSPKHLQLIWLLLNEMAGRVPRGLNNCRYFGCRLVKVICHCVMDDVVSLGKLFYVQQKQRGVEEYYTIVLYISTYI